MQDQQVRNGYKEIGDALFAYRGERHYFEGLGGLGSRNKQKIIHWLLFNLLGGDSQSHWFRRYQRGIYAGFYRCQKDNARHIYYVNLWRMKRVVPGLAKGSITRALKAEGFVKEKGAPITDSLFKILLQQHGIDEKQWSVYTRIERAPKIVRQQVPVDLEQQIQEILQE